MRRPTLRRGATMAMVLSAIFLALALWASNYDRIRGMISMQESAVYGYNSSVYPDVGEAFSFAVACLKVQTPSVTQCRKTFGRGAKATQFTITYTDAGSGNYTVVVTPVALAYSADPVCADCQGAGGP